MPAKPPDQAAGKGGRPASGEPPVEPTSNKPTPDKPIPNKPCPICGKPATATSEPFCSDRCRDVDLNRWLSGSYAIPGKPDDDQDAE